MLQIGDGVTKSRKTSSSPLSFISVAKYIQYNQWIRNQLCGKRRLDWYRLRRNRIISLQHLGEMVKATSKHTRSRGGVYVLVDQEKDGFGSKIKTSV